MHIVHACYTTCLETFLLDISWQLETLNIAEMLNLLGICQVGDHN